MLSCRRLHRNRFGDGGRFGLQFYPFWKTEMIAGY